MNTTNIPPLTLISDIYPFTDALMQTFRRTWLRDLVTVGLDTVAVTAPGSGYAVDDLLVITSATGSGAEGYVSAVDMSGGITAIRVTAPGFGYQASDTASVTSVGGTLATFTANFSRIRLSAYNKAFDSEFFTDADINVKLLEVLMDRQEELVELWNQKFTERIDRLDDDGPAQASAGSQQMTAIFRLLRAECRAEMLDDPGFIGSLADSFREAHIKEWQKAVQADRAWTFSRAGRYGMPKLVRG